MLRKFLLLILGMLCLLPAYAQDASVERGRVTFTTECSRCHLPAEFDGRLRARWIGRSGAEFYQQIRSTMPAETPGSLTNDEYYDLAAFLVQSGNVNIEGGNISIADLESLEINPGIVIAVQADADSTPWTHLNGNVKSTRYSELDQINASNVADLAIAWSLDTGPFGPSPETLSVSTPLMVNGRVYATVGATRNVVALDAGSGQLLWMWRPDDGTRFDTAPRKGSGKGLSYYNSGGEEVIFTITPGYYLVALNAKTGDPLPSFGAGGFIDLQQGLRLGQDRSDLDIGISFPPLVVEDVVIAGAAHEVGMRPLSASNVKGDIRGFDARTGALLWTFKTIPERGQAGYETWLEVVARTQPYPVLPAPYDRQGFQADDLVDFTPESITQPPLLQGVEIPATGKPTRSGLVVTKSLLFFGEGPGGDPWLHTVDKATGETVARIALPASTTGLPMTYMHAGKQYLVVTVSDFSNSARIVALALP